MVNEENLKALNKRHTFQSTLVETPFSSATLFETNKKRESHSSTSSHTRHTNSCSRESNHSKATLKEKGEEVVPKNRIKGP
jgi:hypothetical protein